MPIIELRSRGGRAGGTLGAIQYFWSTHYCEINSLGHIVVRCVVCFYSIISIKIKVKTTKDCIFFVQLLGEYDVSPLFLLKGYVFSLLFKIFLAVGTFTKSITQF